MRRVIGRLTHIVLRVLRFIQSDYNTPEYMIRSLRFHSLVTFLPIILLIFLSTPLLIFIAGLADLMHLLGPMLDLGSRVMRFLRPVRHVLAGLLERSLHSRPYIADLWVRRALVPSFVISLFPAIAILLWYRGHRATLRNMRLYKSLLNTVVCVLPYIPIAIFCILIYGKPEEMMLYESPDLVMYYAPVLIGFVSVELACFNILMICRYVVIGKLVKLISCENKEGEYDKAG
jgi:hypothetical protein